MIGLIVLIVAIVLVLAITPFVLDEKGYVLISFNNTTIEGTIVSFCIMAVISATILFLTYKLVRYLLSIYHNTKHGFFARSEERKQAAIEQALWSAINDDYELVEQTLSGNSVPSKFEDIRLALLAKAALANNEADKALERLFEISPEQQLNVAKLWIASGDSSAIESQMRANADSKKATPLELKLYAEILVQQQHFSALEDFLPRLLRKKVLNDTQWTQLFNAYFNAHSDKITEKYKQLPKKLQAHANTAYLMQMAKVSQLSAIESDLIKMVKHDEQHALLANILSNATSAEAVKLQSSIQERLKKDGANNALLLSLACLANAQGDYELAAKVFDKALNIENKKQFAQQAALSYKNTAQADKALVLYQ
ncbi:putative protoheme IX biogenesis protein [Pseudoalteromonas sp. P1-13-1a]|uniref:heme biosynthesis HemY N-terminal domain-containing protein n=1 Tax=Pseudoalteromonas sp. P1-13-1a TaxID=1723756 RepID=UPI0006D66C24|nr:heme biosynthesis HemY N-terminal domain-containing protein [Pseudoalteromonas sp. P1-13-1a]KPZ55099.1 putative protoheme IX biogenesis protein [Pseudoalteromonas sp. P1-13-1a]